MVLIIFGVCVWLILPFILIPWLIIIHSKYSVLKREFTSYLQRRGEGGTSTAAGAPKQQTVVRPVLQKPAVLPSQETSNSTLPLTASADMREPMKQAVHTAATPALQASEPVIRKSEANDTSVFPDKAVGKSKEAVNVTLIVGVLFVLIAGLIFATTTWKVMPDVLKVVCIGSLSAIFFGVSAFAGKYLKIHMTEVAFYHLGCLFVPVSILALGYFQLLGRWFSLAGDGRYVLLLLMVAVFGILTVIGYRRFKDPALYYLSWVSSVCSVWLLAGCLGNAWRECWLWVWVYGMGIITWSILKRGKAWLSYIHPLFFFVCVTLAAVIYCPGWGSFLAVWCLGMTVGFFMYRFSRHILSVSLDTRVSQILFPAVLSLPVLWEWAITGHFSRALLILCGLLACMVCLLITYQTVAERKVCAWLITLSAGGVYFLAVRVVDGLLFDSMEISFSVMYLLMTLVMLVGNFSPWRRNLLCLFRQPANILAGYLAVIGLIGFEITGIGILLLWEVFLIWVIQKEKPLYMTLAASLWILLPVLTLASRQFSLSVLIYWLVLSVTGFFSCIVSYRLKDGYKRNVVKWTGICGYYLGLSLMSLFYCVNPKDGGGYGAAILLMVLAANILGWKKNASIHYSLGNFFVIPVLGALILYLFPEYESAYVWAGLAAGIGMMALGRKISPTILSFSTAAVDSLGLAAAIAFIPAFWQGSDFWRSVSFLYLAFCCLNLYRRQGKILNLVALAGALVSVYLAWLTLVGGSNASAISGIGIMVCGLVSYLLSKHKYFGTLESGILLWSGIVGYYLGLLIAVADGSGFRWILLALIAGADIIGYVKRESIYFSGGNLLIVLLVCEVMGLSSSDRSVIYPLAGSVTSLLMMVLGRRLFPRLWEQRVCEGRKEYRLDMLGLSAVVGVYAVGAGKYPVFLTAVFLAVWSLNWYKRQNPVISHISMCAWLLFGYLAWAYQPFFYVPVHYRVIFRVGGLLLTCVAVGLIWKNHKRQVNWYWMVIALYSVMEQGLACLFHERLSDVLILGIGMLGVLALAYRKKEYRWLTLSLITLAILALYISRSFWLSIAWWVYLLAAGLLLIGVAARHEYRKREGNDQGKKRQDLMDGWTW